MKIVKKSLAVLLTVIVAVWLIAVLNVNFSSHQYAEVSEQKFAQAKAYLGDQFTPPPASFKWSSFTTDAGITLRSGLLEHPEPKGTVVVVPGFTGAIEMIMREITMLHSAGYRVATLEYRGQGMSYRPLSNHPEKGYVESYELLANELGQYANHVKQDGTPLFFYAISKGAHITMRMAAAQYAPADAYVLITPMIQLNAGELGYDNAVTLGKLMTNIGLGSAYLPGSSAWPNDGEDNFGQANDCNANPASAQAQSALFAMNEKLRTRGVTFKWLYETTKSSAKLLNPEFVTGITEPVKIYTAGIDTLVSTEKAEQFCAALGNCQTQHYPESRHCISRENMVVYDGIIRDAITYFDAVVR